MYKQFLKSILLATVATFSLSTVVSAKPISKNLSASQVYEGLLDGIYTKKDIDAALKKEYPSVMGLEAYQHVIGYEQEMEGYNIDTSYFYAKKAAAKNDALGKFTLGHLYFQGYKQKNGLSAGESKKEGLELVKQACLDGKLAENFGYSVTINGACSAAKKHYQQ